MRSYVAPYRLIVGIFAAASFASGCSAAAPDAGEEVGATSSALNANDQAAYTFFVGKGLTSYQAAGIIGNLDQESGMDPTIAQYGGGPGRGIAQWSAGGRWDTDGNDNVVWYAAKEGQSATSLGLQLDFIWYELTTFSNYGMSELRASTDVTGATVAFETYYEGCGECDQSNRIAYAQAALAAYGSTPPPPPPPPVPRGYLDSATCTSIAGWAEDTANASAAIFTDVYFNGAAGAAGATGIRITAGNNRADLCTAIGSCDHGFSMSTPRGVMDGAAHAVYAYGINLTSGGANTLLTGAPKSVTCAAPAIAAGSVKRHVTNPTILGDWRFDTFTDMAPYAGATLAALPDGADLATAPSIVQAAGDPAVYVVDGSDRRHVTDPTSFAAWRMTSADVKPISAAALAALGAGPDWPAAPLLVKDPSDPAVYMLDVALPAAVVPDGGVTSDAGASPTADAGPSRSDDAGAEARDASSRGRGASSGSSGKGGVVHAPAPGQDAGGAEGNDAGGEPDGAADPGASGSGGGCAVAAHGDPSGAAWTVLAVLGYLTVGRRRARASRVSCR